MTTTIIVSKPNYYRSGLVLGNPEQVEVLGESLGDLEEAFGDPQVVLDAPDTGLQDRTRLLVVVTDVAVAVVMGEAGAAPDDLVATPVMPSEGGVVSYTALVPVDATGIYVRLF